MKLAKELLEKLDDKSTVTVVEALDKMAQKVASQVKLAIPENKPIMKKISAMSAKEATKAIDCFNFVTELYK